MTMKENECQHFQNWKMSAFPEIKFTDVMFQMQTKMQSVCERGSAALQT